MGEGIQVASLLGIGACIGFGLVEYIGGDDKKSGVFLFAVGVILLRLIASGVL